MKTFNYKNISVGYSDSGSGTAIVMLHGFLENRSMWNDLSAVLAKKHRVVTIDLLGHGDTGCLGYVHTMDSNAEMAAALLSFLKIRKCVVIGHSMGGYVALAFADSSPDRIKAMVLLNSTSNADSTERKANRDRAITAVKQNYTSFVRMSIANLFSEANRERLHDEIERIRGEALKTPLQGIVASLEGMKIRKDRKYVLENRNFPVLMFLGRKDEVLNYDENSALAKEMAIDLITFDDGHMSTVENHDQLADALSDFIKKIR